MSEAITATALRQHAGAIAGEPAAIFASADPQADPEGLITKFVAFEAARLKRPGAAATAGSLPQRLDLLFWYLTSYIDDRGAAFSVPLSRQQVEFLNRPVPLAGISPAVTVALQNIVMREKAAFRDLQNPALLRQAVYWWCTARAPDAKLDALITRDQIALMHREERFVGEEYPITAFSAQYVAAHPALGCLDLALASNRAALFHYLVMLGILQPSLLRLLPDHLVRRSLHRKVDGTTLFDRILERFATDTRGATTDATGDAPPLRAIADDLLMRSSLAQTLDQTGHVGETFRPKHLFGATVEAGIALIGPINKTSGLGQATRMSFDVLSRCGHEPTVLPFDLDNPAPVGFATARFFEAYRERRTINLVHLNAESIPLAFAYEQRNVFADSYNIGFFFWELDRIPACHQLALDLLDEIWVASEYNRAIYSSQTSKPVINVGMAVETLPPITALDRASVGIDPNRFIFLATFDSFSFIERKNPLAVVEAFRQAFPVGNEPVQLVLKTQNRRRVFDGHQFALWQRIDDHARLDQRIIVINETMRYADLLALKATCDCYVSLHRSEGWGFGMIEAMQLGRPVIATGYSGNMEFCSETTAFLVDYELVAVRDEEYIFNERGSRWADPSIATAAAHMRTVRNDPALAQRKVAAAQDKVRRHFSLDAIGRRYASRLAEISRQTGRVVRPAAEDATAQRSVVDVAA